MLSLPADGATQRAIAVAVNTLIRIIGAADEPANPASASKFLNEAGDYVALPDLTLTKLSATASQTITAGYGAYAPDTYEIGAGLYLEVSAGSVMEIG